MNIWICYKNLMLNMMKNIFLNGLNNIAPTELNKSIIQSFNYDIAPTEQKFP
ncbi:MAG: hypothetical protein WDZ35_09050 [Crocinitomicaceae bacterium]